MQDGDQQAFVSLSKYLDQMGAANPNLTGGFPSLQELSNQIPGYPAQYPDPAGYPRRPGGYPNTDTSNQLNSKAANQLPNPKQPRPDFVAAPPPDPAGQRNAQFQGNQANNPPAPNPNPPLAGYPGPQNIPDLSGNFRLPDPKFQPGNPKSTQNLNPGKSFNLPSGGAPETFEKPVSSGHADMQNKFPNVGVPQNTAPPPNPRPPVNVPNSANQSPDGGGVSDRGQQPPYRPRSPQGLKPPLDGAAPKSDQAAVNQMNNGK